MQAKLTKRMMEWLFPRPTHYDPVADGLLTAYHKRQQTEQAITDELTRIMRKRSLAVLDPNRMRLK